MQVLFSRYSRYMETKLALVMEFTVKFISICAGLRIQIVFHSTFVSKSYGFFA